jgi:hypothetical protein
MIVELYIYSDHIVTVRCIALVTSEYMYCTRPIEKGISSLFFSFSLEPSLLLPVWKWRAPIRALQSTPVRVSAL